MKKLFTITLVVAMAFAGITPFAYALTDSKGPFQISANVPGSFGLTVEMRKNSFAGAVITSMDFGTLANIGTGTLRSSSTGNTQTGNVRVLLSANNQGLPYNITQTGTPMTLTGNPATVLPQGALVVSADWIDADNGGFSKPGTSTVPSKLGTSWVGTKTLYTSGGTGTAIPGGNVTAFYSITDNPTDGATAGVPLSQAGGAYTSQVTFTMTSV